MEFDVLVVGGGHAGVEASHACAKMGCKTHLITMLVENIALASCNPAIGGLAKGHLVKEIDALGGLMGEITDSSGLQFRTLNASKGYAVRGTRAQIDMDSYRIYARDRLFAMPNLSISQEVVSELLIDNNAVVGLKTHIQKIYRAKKIIIATGTFLNGVVHIGEFTSSNGRVGEGSAISLSENLASIGFEIGRLKTGTCPRVRGSSIDFSSLEIHSGDENVCFSERTDKDSFHPAQYPCYITYTNPTTHEIIRDNFHRAPLFSGKIKGLGPRYCPSIEDKVYRFAEKSRHQLFLEPQTKSCSEYYVNGLSTSLPFDMQERVIHSIEGLERAQITRYGYAIEYDYVNPTALYHTLETRLVKNLYFAGQINGTTGYEEAAAQGLMAGINAALSVRKQGEFVLRRNEAYIGVMIDDLVTKGTQEPYRVFTSRAEYRLSLREDNAIFRLSHYALKFNMLENIDDIERDKEHIKKGMKFLENVIYTPKADFLHFLESIDEERIHDATNGISLVMRDSFHHGKLKKLHEMFENMSERALSEIKIECKYYHYIQKQLIELQKIDSVLEVRIPHDFVFDNIPSLSLEVIEKLNKFRPKTLREAQAISGITPASIDVLHLYIYLRTKHK